MDEIPGSKIKFWNNKRRLFLFVLQILMSVTMVHTHVAIAVTTLKEVTGVPVPRDTNFDTMAELAKVWLLMRWGENLIIFFSRGDFL